MIIQSKVMNPIIFFDELDKVSTTHKGEEINGILTHLTDNTQNNCFNDKFFTGIDFDLSRSMLFFSYNDEYKINPILKDRLTVIKFDSYKLKDKVNIALKYLIPELMKNINIKEDEVIFNESSIQYIIEKYTSHEKGVRNLKRSLEEILMKINLLKLLTVPNNNNEKIKVINTNEIGNIEINKVEINKVDKTDKTDKTNIDIPYKIKNFNLPLTITNEIINILLNEFKKDEMSISVQRMYI
jgi:ATP-dependent Lon protease